MSSWHSYPKIFNMGHPGIRELFDDEVLIEEKVDGSQFSFGVFDGELRARSKGKQIIIDAPEKMFTKAIETVKDLAPRLQEGFTYRAEYLSKPKHNCNEYGRVPLRNLIIFDIAISEECYLSYEDKSIEASRLGLEVVPKVFQGKVENFEQFHAFLEKESILGKCKIEGLVIKNYKKFGADKKILLGKFVSEAFKEQHEASWKAANPGKSDIVEVLILAAKSPVRWQKAVQHLKERGELTSTPKDIGALMKETSLDALSELEPLIKEKLFQWAWPKVARAIVGGLPQWYKEELAKQQFDKI
jgi:RNA ligase